MARKKDQSLNLKKRRGFLLAEETLKIIIAVLCIGFLVYLLFSLYQHTQDSKNLEFAKDSLNFLAGEINSGKMSVDIYNPQGWNLNEWPQNIQVENPLLSQAGESSTSTVQQIPLSCYNLGWKSCICICEENTKDSCDNKGVCINNAGGFTLVPDNNIPLDNPPVKLRIDQDKKEISDGS